VNKNTLQRFPNQRCFALLGTRDEPTDGVEDYCQYLGPALADHGLSLEIVRLRWAEQGWSVALRELGRRSAGWRGAWALLQYTALAWSRRGFPLRVLDILRELKEAGVRRGIVFHDAEPYPGPGTVQWFRRRTQLHVMRAAVRQADLSVLTIPAGKLAWLPARRSGSVFIPVGASLPAPEKSSSSAGTDSQEPLAIAVYSLSPGKVGLDEVATTIEAVRYVAARMGKVRLLVLGRNSEAAENTLRESLRELPVEISVFGLVSAEKVEEVLGASHVLLFPRGPISSRRSSAMAGIACGLPIVAWEGWETAPPLTDAGIHLVREGHKEDLGPALLRVLTDHEYRASLAARSRAAQERYFSWKAIATEYARALRSGESNG